RAILGNPDVLGTGSWSQMLHNDFWGTPLVDSGSHGSYRPLCVASFKLNYLLDGFKPFGYHLVNVLLHSLATGLVVKLARHLLPAGRSGVAIAGLLFAAHPIHTEAVAGVVGRADLTGCIFYLLALLAYIRHVRWRQWGDRRQWLALAATVLLAAAALLCKETAVTALVVCAIYDIIKGYAGSRDKHRARSLGIIALSLAFIVHCRLTLPRPATLFSTADNPTARSGSLWTRFLTFTYLPVVNFKLLLLPDVLSFDWGMDAIPRLGTVCDRKVALAALFYLALGWALWSSCRALVNRQQSPVRPSGSKTTPNASSFNRKLANKLNLARLLRTTTTNNNDSASINYNQSFQGAVVGKKFACHWPLGTVGDGASKEKPFPFTTLLTAPADMCSPSLSSSSYASSSSSSSSSSTSSSCASSVRGDSADGSTDEPCLPDEGNSLHNSPAAALVMSVALLALPFLPASNLLFYVGFVVAERILYLPSVGYCLLVGLAGRGGRVGRSTKPFGPRRRQLVLVCVGLLLIAYSAKTVRRNRDWADEESLFRSAVAVNPPKALGNLGSVLSAQGRYQEAKEALKAALNHRPNMADVHYNLGILLQNQQDYNEAVESFRKAIRFRPSLALAYLNLGTSLIALGRCQEAASVLREGTKLDGAGLRDRAAHENARISALLQLGNLYADQGKLQRALAIYREALHTLPERYPPQGIYHRLGDIFARLNQWSEAERFQRAALEAQPDHIAAHLSYGTMLARNSSRTSEAEQWFRRALRLAPNDASVHHHYAEFLSSQRRTEEAFQYRVKAAELAPEDYALVMAAASSLRLLDRKLEAERWYRQAVKLRPQEARAHTNLGAILHLLGRTQEAANSYREALRLQPDDLTTLSNLAKLGVPAIS
ncbi:AGAP009112-PA, partial [Anopheles gambiae str. PEST]